MVTLNADQFIGLEKSTDMFVLMVEDIFRETDVFQLYGLGKSLGYFVSPAAIANGTKDAVLNAMLRG